MTSTVYCRSLLPLLLLPYFTGKANEISPSPNCICFMFKLPGSGRSFWLAFNLSDTVHEKKAWLKTIYTIIRCGCWVVIQYFPSHHHTQFLDSPQERGRSGNALSILYMRETDVTGSRRHGCLMAGSNSRHSDSRSRGFYMTLKWL